MVTPRNWVRIPNVFLLEPITRFICRYCIGHYDADINTIFASKISQIKNEKTLFVPIFTISIARLIQKTVDFDDFAQATWSYDNEYVANQDAPLRHEITTKFTEFCTYMHTRCHK